MQMASGTTDDELRTHNDFYSYVDWAMTTSLCGKSQESEREMVKFSIVFFRLHDDSKFLLLTTTSRRDFLMLLGDVFSDFFMVIKFPYFPAHSSVEWKNVKIYANWIHATPCKWVHIVAFLRERFVESFHDKFFLFSAINFKVHPRRWCSEEWRYAEKFLLPATFPHWNNFQISFQTKYIAPPN